MPIIEPYREVSGAILVGTCGRLLLQQRDDITGILYPGMIGLFGGHREGAETPLECLMRELEEETSIKYRAEQITPFVDMSIAYPAGGGVKGAYFIVRDVEIERTRITEGQPLVTTREELPVLLAHMAPTACYVTRLFMQL
jgi:8-oxo-dGTP diphosphatase